MCVCMCNVMFVLSMCSLYNDEATICNSVRQRNVSERCVVKDRCMLF